MKASDEAKEEGGNQCTRIKDESGNWITIPLKLKGDKMKIYLRTPT